MSSLPVQGVLGIPAVALVLLALIPGWHLGARLNALAAGLTFLAALFLLGIRPLPGDYLMVDDFNVYLIVLNTFVGFTTSIYSASYIDHELETGRLTPAYLRFYHAMYQAMLGAMNLALLANNIGLLWVAVEFATLSTVIMVGIYRTPEALEAAWKYFILGSVGIALVAGLLAWRMAIGGFEMHRFGDESMVLRIPTWIGFAVVVPAFALFALAGLVRAWRDLEEARRGGRR